MTTEEQTSFDSDSSVLTWQDRVRRGLASDDVRLRLHSYSTLSTKCSESKEMQKQVGQLFGGPRNGIFSRFASSSLLNVLFDDLRSTDRTLRIAAARVLCLMAYENLRNQQLIIQSQVNGDEEQGGATVGWMHVFSIPPSLRDRYEAQCEERGLFTTPSGLVEFVSDVIEDNYASIYSRIGRYYAEGCRDFLPLCWFHDFVNDSSEPTDLMDIPDPNENLLGFYLVPRQMQFPEQDDYFLQEVLASIRTEAELSRLQQVHTAYEKVAFRAKESNAAALKKALEEVCNRSVGGEKMNQGHSNVLQWLNASPDRIVTWNELLLWCCTDMNAEEMLKRFGAEACKAVDDAFRKLILGNEKMQLLRHEATSYVWESTLVGTLLEHRDIPEQLKANIRVLSSGYVTRLDLSRRKIEGEGNNPNNISAPWEYLLPLELTEIHPISWGVFLSKWRQSVDSKPDEEPHIYHQNERRHHSVGEHSHPSLLIARKNALVSLSNSPRIFHSFRDLNQLRQQLPLIANRPSEVPEEVAESVPMSNRLRSITENQLSAAEQRDLDEKRKLFRKLQQSSIELDEMTRQQLEKKREERCKAHEKAAENREKKQQLAAQRLQEMERRRHDRHLKVQERIRRKEHRWQSRIAVRQERHERAQWWKQVQQDAEVERQEEFMQQLKEERESTYNLHTRSEPIVATVSLPQPPRAPCPRRPLSARTPTDPHIIRERAHVYGCAATNAFAARRPHTARADLSDTRSRRRVRPPDNKGDGQPDTTNTTVINESNSSNPPAPTLVNACQTLVMTNAAHAVAQEIAIPTVTGPVPEDQFVAPAVIMAQYLALEKDQRFKLHERYCGNRVSHKLTFAVLQQLTHEMRQDAAWREFLKAAGGPPGANASKRNKSKREAKVTYAAFASVAAQLGITTPPKKLQAVARSLDPWKTGFVTWEAFYTWWSSQ